MMDFIYPESWRREEDNINLRYLHHLPSVGEIKILFILKIIKYDSDHLGKFEQPTGKIFFTNFIEDKNICFEFF